MSEPSGIRGGHGAWLPATYLPFVAAAILFLGTGHPPLSPAVHDSALHFDAKQAMRDLERIDEITREHGGRVSGTPGNRATGDYLVAALGTLPFLTVSEQVVTAGSRPLRNILATRAGRSASEIIVAAHYDSACRCAAAVDNAAGTAVALELARALGAEARRNTLRFAFFDGEERDTGGSVAYVDSLTTSQRERIRAVISLDALGWRDGSPVIHTIAYEDRSGRMRIAPDWLVGTLLRAARGRDLPLALGDARSSLLYQVLARGGHTNLHSDDRPFARAGVPALFLANFSFTNFYPYYHEPTDTIDKVSSEQLDAMGKVVEAGLIGLDALAATPPDRPGYLFLGTRRLTMPAMLALSLLAGLPTWWLLAGKRRERRASFRLGAGLLVAGFATGVAAGTPEIVFTLYVLPVLLLPITTVTARRSIRLAGFLSIVPAGAAVATALALSIVRPRAVALPVWQIALLAALLGLGVISLRAGRPLSTSRPTSPTGAG